MKTSAASPAGLAASGCASQIRAARRAQKKPGAERSGRFVRMFKPRFAGLVAAGVKEQTVRPVPKRMPKAGDEISLRMWTGKPYRSKQRVLAEALITKVETFELWVENPRVPRWNWKFIVGGKELDQDEWARFSRADGFDFTTDLIDWFAENHELPFTGIVIHWTRNLCNGECGICGGTRIRPLPKFADACECDLVRWAAGAGRGADETRRTDSGPQTHNV